MILGSTLIGRGEYSLTDMRSYVERLQKKAKFTTWSSKAIRIGLCNVPPSGHSVAHLALFNTSSMATLFSNIYKQFNKLYEKKVIYVLSFEI